MHHAYICGTERLEGVQHHMARDPNSYYKTIIRCAELKTTVLKPALLWHRAIWCVYKQRSFIRASVLSGSVWAARVRPDVCIDLLRGAAIRSEKRG